MGKETNNSFCFTPACPGAGNSFQLLALFGSVFQEDIDQTTSE